MASHLLLVVVVVVSVWFVFGIFTLRVAAAASADSEAAASGASGGGASASESLSEPSTCSSPDSSSSSSSEAAAIGSSCAAPSVSSSSSYDADTKYEAQKVSFMITSAYGTIAESYAFQQGGRTNTKEFANTVFARFEEMCAEQGKKAPSKPAEGGIAITNLTKTTSEIFVNALLETAVDTVGHWSDKEWKRLVERYAAKLFEYFRAHYASKEDFDATGVYENFDNVEKITKIYLDLLQEDSAFCEKASINFGKNPAAKLDAGDDVRAYLTFKGCLGETAFRAAEDRLITVKFSVYSAVLEHILMSHGVIADTKRHKKKTAALNESGGAGVVDVMTLSAL